MDWLEIIQNLLELAALIAIAGLLFIQWRLSKDLIRHREVYTKRAEAVAKLYEMIVKLEWEVGSYTQVFSLPEKEAEEKKAESAKVLDEVRYFFFKSRIFFEEGLAKDIDRYLEVARDNLIQFNAAQTVKQENYGAVVKAYAKAVEANGQLANLKRLIEKRFRGLLGIKKNER